MNRRVCRQVQDTKLWREINHTPELRISKATFIKQIKKFTDLVHSHRKDPYKES